MKFYKYFEFVQSFHTSAFAGKSLVTNKFTSQLSSDTAINFDDQVARHNVANASYPDTRREQNKTTVSEVSITDRYETYIIHSNSICSGVNERLVVVLVHTAVANFERRKLIRITWGNIRLSMLENHPMRVVFLLGKPGKEQHQTAMNLENEQHGDIVQGKFLDTYHNLTEADRGHFTIRTLTELDT